MLWVRKRTILKNTVNSETFASRNRKITLQFTDVCKSGLSHNFYNPNIENHTRVIILYEIYQTSLQRVSLI